MEPETLRECLNTLANKAVRTLFDLDWPELKEEPELDYRPFPVDSLPSIVAKYVKEHSAAMGCDSAFIAVPALSALAGVIGNTRRLRLKNTWSAPAL